MIKVGSYEFDSPLNMEGSWGSRQIAANAHSVMTLYDMRDDGNNFYLVEWEAGEDDFESINLYLGSMNHELGEGTVIDIDGVMSNPPQLFELLDKYGVKYDPMLKE